MLTCALSTLCKPQHVMHVCLRLRPASRAHVVCLKGMWGHGLGEALSSNGRSPAAPGPGVCERLSHLIWGKSEAQTMLPAPGWVSHWCCARDSTRHFCSFRAPKCDTSLLVGTGAAGSVFAEAAELVLFLPACQGHEHSLL